MEVQQRLRFPKRQKGFYASARSEAADPGPAALGRRVGTTAGAVRVALAVAGGVGGDGGTAPDSGGGCAGRSGSSGSNPCSIKSQNWNQIGFNKFMMG